ncbi:MULTISPECIES: hypothetical protein [Cycloclasticus]|uniref:Plasmid stabilization protein n=1 Tax=Cycloclasticus pugetii TaxID=34068 RepID=A0AB33Z121_9GAMM|nr:MULTISPECIES: hypothetical protein [Cycloclasticus]ATI02412.1 plasmid stabilization protein [Cycloclasticus sp. PY97N]EPD12873.1 hypothetical protein L196_06914 [Cycloclasticus pugetii]
MNYTLIYTDSYIKRARKFSKQHPELKEQYRKALLLLAANPKHPSLRLHKLSGKLAGLSSVSINASYRITLEFVISEKAILLVNVGSHDRAYK